VSHPQHLPELTSYDYDITGPLMEALGTESLQSDEEVQELVHEWHCTQSKEFFFIRNTGICTVLGLHNTMWTMLKMTELYQLYLHKISW
jgi:hypothetical protein